MKNTSRRALVAAVVALGAIGVGIALAEGKPASPHDKVSASIGTAKVTIEYGRPYKKGREIFGGLVPYGEVWRTGADEASTLTTDADLVIGDLKVPKGTYGLFTVPNKDGWLLVLNKNAKQWGAFKYDAKEDFGRATMKVSALAAPVEQFTIALTPGADKKVSLDLSWDKTLASVAITAAK